MEVNPRPLIEQDMTTSVKRKIVVCGGNGFLGVKHPSLTASSTRFELTKQQEAGYAKQRAREAGT